MGTKGEEYYVSNVDTGRGINTPMYPWIISFCYKKVLESHYFNCIHSIYHNERPFFNFILVTLFVLSASLYAVLPETILLWANLLVQNSLSFTTPILLYSNVYIWIGLAMKHFDVFFSMKACVASCIILEVLLEILSNSFSMDIMTESTLTLTIMALMLGVGMSTSGALFQNMNNIGTLVIVNSIIVVRLLVIPSTATFGGWFDFLKPIFVYLYTICGLALSTWPPLKIFSSIKKETNRNFTRHLQGEMSNSIPVIRPRRASSIEMKSSHMQNGILHNQNKTRRKSLPALGGAPSARKVSMSSMDLTILGEAHGMITDLLADSSLPLNVTGTLRIVADMISPLLQHSLHRQGAPLLTVLEKTKNNEDQEKVQNQPDLKDDTPLSLKQRLQRNLGVSSRRMSSSYTTTTSATGMPTIDMEYHHKKSNANKTSANSTSSPTAIKKTSSRSKSYAGALTPAERSNLLKSHSRSFSQSTSPTQSGLLRKELATSDDTIFKVEIERGKPVFFEGMDASESENETNESADEDTVKDIVSLNGCNSNNNNNNINRTKFVLDERLEDVKETPERESIHTSSQNKTNSSVFENDVSPEVESTSVDPLPASDNVEDKVELASESTATDVDKMTETTPPKRGLRKMSDTSRTLRSNSTGSVKNELKSSDSSDNLIIPASNQMRRKSSRELHMEYEIAISRDIDDMLSKVKEWDFPIFELSEKCNVLTQLAFRIFQLCDFFKTFKIAEVTFLKFFRALESGYHNIPYHNRIHAADVLHGVYYLTQHRIPGFNSDLSRRPSLTENEKKVTPSSSPQDSEIVLKKEEKFGYGCICDSVPDLELMALYVAAAMHDFDHPGRTNAFLVATLNSKALLYNDRSVLESHHAAASWSLLVTNPGLNFLSTLDPADFKRFRFIVIEEILSTDLKKHFDFLTEWNAKISDQGGGLNFSSEADRLLLGQMAIKIADISGPSKEWDLHYRWTERIIEEFYQQGEDERTLGMPTSAYMDRNNPQVPQLQASFIKHLVQPLYIAYEKAGILPGEWVEVEEGDQDEEGSELDASGEEGDEDILPKGGDKIKATINGPTTKLLEDEEDDSNKDASTDETDSSTDDGDKKAIFCVMSDNIKRNYEKWLRIIEEEKEESGEATEDTENGT